MKIYNIKTYFTSLMSCVLLISCNIEEVDVTRKPFVAGEVENPVTITQVIIKDPNLSILEKLMRRIESSSSTTKILSDLNLPGNNTMFVPTDSVFESFMQTNGITNIDNLPLSTVTTLVYNHLLTGKFLVSDLKTGLVFSEATRGSGTSKVKLNLHINTTDGVVLNGNSKVVTPDVQLQNGVIHYVDKVIDIPTITKMLSLYPEFSSFKSAINYADSKYTATVLSDLINNTSASVTVFAPTNNAFSSVFTELNVVALQDLTKDQVEKIVKIHTVSTAITAPAMSLEARTWKTNARLQTTLATALGQVNFNSTDKSITDPRKRIAKINTLDIQCENGVIHSVDKVVLPVTLYYLIELF